ncbi:MAG: hypothetical protein LBC56_06505 [Oscillospiraceae bacterium]|jgi:hypothetical protein|nr:hypothetical protein [Oscillospiraceae bacterium]
MKKLFFVILVFALLSQLASCKGAAPESAEAAGSAGPESTAQDSSPTMEESGELTGSFFYSDLEYGFRLTFPDEWQGFDVKTSGFDSGNSSASAFINGEIVSVDCNIIEIFSPEFPGNPDIQPVVIALFRLEDWNSFDDAEPGMKEVWLNGGGGASGMSALAMNDSYVFTLGWRSYGFAYGEGVDEAMAIANSLTVI